MNIDVFKSKQEGNKFLLLQSGDNPNNYSEDLFSEFNQEKFKTISVFPDNHLIGLDSKDAMKNLETKGYYIAKVRINSHN